MRWYGWAFSPQARSAIRRAGPGWLGELAAARRAARLRRGETTLWVAAERLPQFAALWSDATLDPAIAAPSAYAEREWSPDLALVEILRGRLEGHGPVAGEALAAALGLTIGEIAAPLAALEAEGFALRGRFTPDAASDEWCERRLLARIHRYTVKRLRAEIEPVAARDFLRFLFDWQRVAAGARMEGPDALAAIIGQLEGFEAPAGAWETEILPARLAGYDPAWLDDLCLSGRVAWARLRPRPARGTSGERGVSPVRTTPITLLARRHASHWTLLSSAEDTTTPSAEARRVADVIRQDGASFFDELADGSRLLRPQVETALGELVALGLVTSDSFAGLRALIAPNGGQSSPPPVHQLCDGGCRALGARTPPALPGQPAEGCGGGERASGARPAAPLRRGVLAPRRARGGMAAAVARSAARLSPAGGTR